MSGCISVVKCTRAAIPFRHPFYPSKPAGCASAIVEVIEFLQPIGHAVLEAREIAEPFQLDFAHRTVALFRNDDLRLSGVLLLILAAVVILLAVDEHDDVGV